MLKQTPSNSDDRGSNPGWSSSETSRTTRERRFSPALSWSYWAVAYMLSVYTLGVSRLLMMDACIRWMNEWMHGSSDGTSLNELMHHLVNDWLEVSLNENIDLLLCACERANCAHVKGKDFKCDARMNCLIDESVAMDAWIDERMNLCMEMWIPEKVNGGIHIYESHH